jgi:Flp pilus assembly protein TadG
MNMTPEKNLKMQSPTPTNRRSSRRSGSVIVLVALAMVAICGFCALTIDFGRSVMRKNQLQRATDAAALAGVQYLPGDPATAKIAARYYAYLNGINVDTSSIIVSNNNTRITVPATSNVRYFFAPVMRVLSGNVPAQSIAAVQVRTNFTTPNVVPIGITPSTYAAFKGGQVTEINGIRQNKTDLDISEFVMMDLRDGNQGKSPAQMQNQLQWGSTFSDPVTVGGVAQTLNAFNTAQAKNFREGLQTRFTAAAGAPWYDTGNRFPNIPAGSPLIMNFIMTPEQQAVNGNNNAPILGFVPVYIESFSVVGTEMKIKFRFLPLDSGGGGSYTDATSTNPEAANLRIPRLVS